VFNHPDIETAELIANHYPRPMLFCNYPHIAERLDQEAHGRWSTSFPQGETASVAGGLRLNWPASSRRQRGIKLSWMPGEIARKMDGT
jgi:hypothetical protein